MTEETKKQLSDLKTSFATTMGKLKQIKGYGDTMSDGECNDDTLLLLMMDNLAARIDYLSNSFWDYTYNHGKGHLPPVKTSSGMEKALKVLGMGDDYEVYKPSISVANTSLGQTVVASYKKNEKKA